MCTCSAECDPICYNRSSSDNCFAPGLTSTTESIKYPQAMFVLRRICDHEPIEKLVTFDC